MKDHKHYDLAYRAHINISFYPEFRAETLCREYDQMIEGAKEFGATDNELKKLDDLWTAWMHCKGRCISSMVTGPANFPARRAEKANISEHNACVTLLNYYDKIKEDHKREAFYKRNPHKRPVRAGEDDATERLKDKIRMRKSNHEAMKEHNAKVRSGDIEGKVFEPWALQNNLAEIKRLEGRLSQLEQNKERGDAVVKIGEVEVRENTESMRLQLFFPGKPERETITILKKNGFRWAPSVKAWQRQLTENALSSFRSTVEPHLKSKASVLG